MNFDPHKFFLGLMDFFSILLLSTLITNLLMVEVGPIVLGDRNANLKSSQAWAAFLFSSNLSGHLIFLFGAWLYEFYDWARRYTLNTQITLLACLGRVLPWLTRAFIGLMFNPESNFAVERAEKIKQHPLDYLQVNGAINTFHWSEAWWNAENPTSLAVVQCFEADSKLTGMYF